MCDNDKLLPPIIALPLLHAQAKLGEGAIWNYDDQQLYWVDIDGCALHIFDPVTGTDKQFHFATKVGTVVPVQDGDVLVALENGIHRLDITTGKSTLIINPITLPGIRFNDGKCDPSGRFWVGTMATEKATGAGILYRMDTDGTLHEMLHNVTISNGIVWTSDKRTMYYNDTPTQTVQAFDYDDITGNISNLRIAIRIPKNAGAPDGMTIDAEDKLWIAMWGAGCINRYDPLTGNLLQQVKVPVPNVSSCAFGDADRKTLFITTASVELTADELQKFPLSGDLFYARVDVSGVLSNFYKPANHLSAE